MPHALSLAITYIAMALSFIYLVRKIEKCTTTQQQGKPQQTEPSPTGQTPTTLRQSLDEWEAQYRQLYGLKSPYKTPKPGEEASGTGR